jgi:hypothetical protein
MSSRRQRSSTHRAQLRQVARADRRCTVAACIAAEETDHYQWCHHDISGISRNKAREGDANGKGWIRASSPPFFHSCAETTALGFRTFQNVPERSRTF